MPFDKRVEEPLYVNGFTYEKKLSLSIETIREKERQEYKKAHRENYEFYNKLFGDYRERRNRRQRERYWADPEFSRQRAREYYQKYYQKQGDVIREEIMPECRLDCENCKYSDCILPEDWRKKANKEDWKRKHPDYFVRYREQNRELLREKNKKYYAAHREEILTAQRLRRSEPEVKEQRAAYDKQYRAAHPEKARERKRRYRARHPDRVREQKRRYYEKTKKK